MNETNSAGERTDWHRGAYTISTRKSLLDLSVIHSFLTTSYWARGVTEETVRSSIENSLCFGLYVDQHQQIGFARVITDFATFAYIADVFVLPPHRKRGLAKWLISTVVLHPTTSSVRGWLLKTADAHGLYKQCGFSAVADPEKFMWRPQAPGGVAG